MIVIAFPLIWATSTYFYGSVKELITTKTIRLEKNIETTQISEPQPSSTTPISQPTIRLIYSSKGRLMAYDFSLNQPIDLGLTGVTRYLWSKDGKLAVLVQGEYAGKIGLLDFPQAHATTAGFNYLLYLVDLKGGPSKLLLAEVFGEVFWGQESDGLYVSERYLGENKQLLYNQSGLKPNQEKFFYVNLDGKKSTVSRAEFQKEFSLSDRLSPDGKYAIINDYPFDSVVALDTGVKYPIKLEYSTSTSRSKWSPDGDRVAFIYHVDERATQDQILNTLKRSDILSERFTTQVRNLPSGESVDFDWVNEESLLVSQLEYVTQPGHHTGNIGIFNVVTDKFTEIIPTIRQTVPYTGSLLMSPDRKFFAYMESENLEKEMFVVADIQGNKVLRLPGRDPTWQPVSVIASIAPKDAARKVSELSEVKDFLQRVQNGKVVFDHEDAYRNDWVFHVYEELSDHLATFNWYDVDETTGEISKQFDF